MIFKERKSSFSLDLMSFGLSILDGARSKVDLRGESCACMGTNLVEFLLSLFFG